MSLKEHRQSLMDALASDAANRERAASFMAFLRHELGNVVGTFTMETHMLGVLTQGLREATESGDVEGVARMIGELEEMHENLLFASTRAAQFIADLRDP